jgi:hypothetical protein
MRSKLKRLNPWFVYPGAIGLTLLVLGIIAVTLGLDLAGWAVLAGLVLVSVSSTNVIFFRGLYAKN